MVRLRVINVLRREMSACRKIIAGKVAEKGNRQQRGCSFSRKWSHTRSRCKCRTHVAISVALPDNERRLQAKSAAMCRSSIERSAPTSETSKCGARNSLVAAFLPRCIFNLTMNGGKRQEKLPAAVCYAAHKRKLARRLIGTN